MITAHSGCDRTGDNSMAFVRYALSLPVDALEVDVRRNACGELVLGHDAPAEDAVRLAEVFDLLRAHPEKKINCDLKQKGLEADVAALAQAHGTAYQLIFTGDVNPTLFRKGQMQFPGVIWYANLEVFLPEFSQWQRAGMSQAEQDAHLRAVLEQMTAYETAGLNWHFSLVERVWEQAREMGMGVSVWTVNEPEEQKRWLARHVDNITTRETALLLALRGG